VNARANDDTAPLFWACLTHTGTGSAILVRFLLQRGADVNAQYGNHRAALLHFAHDLLRPDLLPLLFEFGADPNIRSADMATPLHAASQKRDLSFARVLLDKGAEINAADARGNTPLMLAIEAENTAMVELLRERGALE
jgi:ankyrin repeat protein